MRSESKRGKKHRHHRKHADDSCSDDANDVAAARREFYASVLLPLHEPFAAHPREDVELAAVRGGAVPATIGEEDEALNSADNSGPGAHPHHKHRAEHSSRVGVVESPRALAAAAGNNIVKQKKKCQTTSKLILFFIFVEQQSKKAMELCQY